MGPQEINTRGAGKGAISPKVSYATAAAAAKTEIATKEAAAKAAQALQQKNAKNASLKKSIDNLTAQSKGYKAEFDKQNKYLTYDKNMITTNMWGTDIEYNQKIYNSQYISGPSNAHNESNRTLTTEDKRMILDDISRVELLVDAAQKSIAENNTIISADKAIINGKSSPQVPTGSSGLGNNYNSTLNNTKLKNTDPSTQTTIPKPPPEWPDSSYQWNLPPHTWSLPKDPSEVTPGFVNKQEGSLHATRRGRIWYYNGYVGKNSQAQYDYNNTGTFSAAAGAAKTPPPGTVNKYGFQFIWNPETFSQQTAVNMAVTPSNTDPTVALTGFAAANSQMTFTIRLDRTNDFASIKAENLSTTLSTAQQTPADIALASANAALYAAGKVSQQDISKTQSVTAGVVEAHGLANYYKVGQPIKGGESSANNINQKIVDLLNYGTESDLEYLYKTINGDGWTGIGGRDTSNIGYLMPALIRLDLGNQKFVGVVSSVSVNHLAFTRNMIPIRSDVNITVDLRANIQPTTNVNPGKKP